MKMSGKTIPEQIKNQVDEIVKIFNKKVFKDPNCYYVTRYKGNYLYLDRMDYSSKISVCRLQFLNTAMEGTIPMSGFSLVLDM